MPNALKIAFLGDQSVFVRSAIESVVREALIAAGLTGLMIMMFLGSWRSTLIIVISIPLSIMFSIVVLHTLGQTLNAMTLGGLALAVGVLIDDATVEIENIHRNLHQRKPLTHAIMDGAREIAVPSFVSTLCICIVFAPIAFLTGAARSLFVPMGVAVVAAMLMSYLLSRTLVPTMARHLLVLETAGPGMLTRAVERAFTMLRWTYGRVLAWALQNRSFVLVAFALFVVGSLMMVTLVGQDFFPSVDAGDIKLHVRCAPGTRIEETEKQVLQIERTIETLIPREEIDSMLDIIGVPLSTILMTQGEGAAISSADAQILISLKPGHHPTASYVRALRGTLGHAYPSDTFFFLAPDLASQVLNFGLAAPLDLQVRGPVGSEDQTIRVARDLADRVARVPGNIDVHIAQVLAVPSLQVDVDRAEAQQQGITERDVATDLVNSLAATMIAPTYWLDKRGVQYLVAIQTPQAAIDSLDAINGTPISTARKPQTLGNLAQLRRVTRPANITHYDRARTYDVLISIDGTDLGSALAGVKQIVAEVEASAPKGTQIRIKGQAEAMESSFGGLRAGVLLAIALVYLLMVVFFQSWVDPLIILMALPGALCGIVWILFLTGTTLSVPALIGSIMCVGVATANSILVVSFANELRLTREPRSAALIAGITRLRPVLMTGLAMVLGMLPMAIGLGEGSEQNAPLGRAVIGGLVLATITTLIVVPVIFSWYTRNRAPTPPTPPEIAACRPLNRARRSRAGSWASSGVVAADRRGPHRRHRHPGPRGNPAPG